MVDLKKKYVRITGIKNDKYVEFDFSIDDPEIFVELVLPFSMFRSFCETNQVETLPPNDDMQGGYDRMLWRIGDAGATVFRN